MIEIERINTFIFILNKNITQTDVYHVCVVALSPHIVSVPALVGGCRACAATRSYSRSYPGRSRCRFAENDVVAVTGLNVVVAAAA